MGMVSSPRLDDEAETQRPHTLSVGSQRCALGLDHRAPALNWPVIDVAILFITLGDLLVLVTRP